MIFPLSSHLVDLYKTIDRFHPGQLLTATAKEVFVILDSILSYSLDLWQLEDDVLNSPHQ